MAVDAALEKFALDMEIQSKRHEEIALKYMNVAKGVRELPEYLNGNGKGSSNGNGNGHSGKKCEICGGMYLAKGMCGRHYRRWQTLKLHDKKLKVEDYIKRALRD